MLSCRLLLIFFLFSLLSSAQSTDQSTDKNSNSELVSGTGDEVIMHEKLVQIHGNGVVKYQDITLSAEHIWAELDENIIHAFGNVKLTTANETTIADEMTYNLDTKQGIARDGRSFSDPWYYRGIEIFKIDETQNYVKSGSITSCSLEKPHYYFSATEIVIELKKELIAKNVVMKIGGVPLFYLPVYRRDLRKNKESKIIVRLGNDSYQGPFLSIELPIARQKRYNGALLFDQSSRRGRGGGFNGKYRFNDIKYQEIFIPIPEEASEKQKSEAQKIAEELSKRLRGEKDHYDLQYIFLKYSESLHREEIKTIANKIYKNAIDGTPFDQLAKTYEFSIVDRTNLSLEEMDKSWQFSVRHLDKPGDITPLIFTAKGIYIFKLINREKTITFEELAEEFQADRGEEVLHKKHQFRGEWEQDRVIFLRAKSLDRGEFSSPIKSDNGYFLVKTDKKRNYSGDLSFYTNDEYSSSRENAVKIGQRTGFRWGHNQKIRTPWDNRLKGRKPISLMNRIEWQAKKFDEGFGTSTNLIKLFGVLTWGSAFSTMDQLDTDAHGNLKFSNKSIGEFLARLQFNRDLDLTHEKSTAIQKLPELSLSFSRIKVDRLPLLRKINSGMKIVSEKLHTELPILSLFTIPTLENIGLDLDLEVGNFYRESYGEETDLLLRAGTFGINFRKQSTLDFSRTRSARLNLSFNSDLIWHDHDRNGRKNIVRNAYSGQASLSNSLFRIYDIRWIPRARRMRHKLNSTLSFRYAPKIDRDENLYPFGPSAYFSEKKDLTFRFDTSFEIKTVNKKTLKFLEFRTSARADFTEYATERNQKFDTINSSLTFVPLPSRNLRMTFRTAHDANKSDDGEKFPLLSFRSNISYRREKWNFTFGNAFSRRSSSVSRRLNGSFQLRPNKWIELNFQADYDWIERQFYSQQFSLRRNLHDWNLRISWHRSGFSSRTSSSDSVRNDFTFQLDLIADPSASLGLGYDAATGTLGFRSVPAGIPYNAFGIGNALGKSFF